MSLIVVATFTPKPGEQEAVVTALSAAVGSTLDERGCEKYALHQSSREVVVIEQWESGDALKAHSESKTMVNLTAALEGRLSGPMKVQVVRPVATRPADPRSMLVGA